MWIPNYLTAEDRVTFSQVHQFGTNLQQQQILYYSPVSCTSDLNASSFIILRGWSLKQILFSISLTSLIIENLETIFTINISNSSQSRPPMLSKIFDPPFNWMWIKLANFQLDQYRKRKENIAPIKIYALLIISTFFVTHNNAVYTFIVSWCLFIT